MASIGRLKIFGRGLGNGRVAAGETGSPVVASTIGVAAPAMSSTQFGLPLELAGSKKTSLAVLVGDGFQVAMDVPETSIFHIFPSVSLKKTRWTEALSPGR